MASSLKKQIRFISTPEQAKNLQKFPLEASSISAWQNICKKHRIDFELISVDEFLQKRKWEEGTINLLLDAKIEGVLYSEYWNPPLPIDGVNLVKTLGDKYHVYKMLTGINELKQPKTFALRSQQDFQMAMEKIQTKKIVIKPRFSGYASMNVAILNKERIENLEVEERWNVKDSIAQEYLPDTKWPPQEWRFHFVGRKLCRILKITDKNNWMKNFKIENFALGNAKIPRSLIALTSNIAAALIQKDIKDNLTLDFLETKEDFIFLEANCGALNSFYVVSPEEEKFLEPIIEAIIQDL